VSVSKRKPLPRTKRLDKVGGAGDKGGKRRERSGGNSTGPATSSKRALVEHDEVTDLVVRAYNLTETAHVLMSAVREMHRELDKLRAMCETLNDRLLVEVAKPDPPRVLEGVAPMQEVDDGWWQTLEGEALQGSDKRPPLAKRQLSFYDTPPEAGAEGPGT